VADSLSVAAEELEAHMALPVVEGLDEGEAPEEQDAPQHLEAR